MSCIFSFKKEAKVYIVHNNIQYSLDISSIDFGQTFTEYSYSNKTIQEQNMFEQSVINKANPATFEFTFPAIKEDDLHIVFDRAIDYDIFDLYIEMPQYTFKVEKCVITNSTFILEPLKPLGMNVSGEGVRLTRWMSAIPGTPKARSNTMAYSVINWVNIVLAGGVPKDSLKNISIELNTEVVWTPYTSTNKALAAIDANSSMYPEDFTVSKRSLQGAFTIYTIIEKEWLIDTSLFIEVGQKVSGTFYGFEFDINSVSIQSTFNTDEVFSQSFTWRMTENPIHLSQVISYKGVVDSSGIILDSWGLNILDSFGNPILEN